MSLELRVGVVQNRPRFLKAPENLRACLSLMDKERADVWVLPEFFASGYAFRSRAEAARRAERADGPLAAVLRAYAAQRGCAIIAGFPEKAGKRLYNSAMLVTPEKTRVYRKTHVFGGELRFFSPGDTGFWVEEWRGVKIGLMICYDWFFPESARALALAGAQLIAHPANLVLPWCPEAMKIRSLENRVFSATANRVGAERGLRFIGQSQIVSPNGSLLLRLGHDEERAAAAVLDAWTAKDKKVTPVNDLFADRRPRFYGRAKS